MDHWSLKKAFQQSLIWRSYNAFSDSTRETMNKLCQSEHDVHDTLDVLLTVATLPGHPFNALFLDRRLRKDSMPDRDSWWSVYLHQAWGTDQGIHGAIERLVDWASSLPPDAPIDDETIDLCSITLSWMFTASNRFLRDRATGALVNLLTGHLAAVARLVERFADVDDPYVAERVYSVAYGVSMRCHNPASMCALAASVYARVFEAGSPPPHILLRDYARGVVERALHLGSAIDVDPERIRPPYKSQWPAIPTEDDIKPLRPDRSQGSYAGGEPEWGRNRIGSSVMEDDFARYVIGTNSPSSEWLSLRRDEATWKPPVRSEYQLLFLFDEPPRFDLSEIQRYTLWRVFNLGWTTERFGHFDEFVIGDHGREASKPERIGKKYQWIAYHEIMALVADHFQYYREYPHEEDGDHEYEGPWQNHLRDIDPSCTMPALRGGTSWEGHTAAWWGSARYDKWEEPGRPRDWVQDCHDLPQVEELLIVTDPADGSRWLNGQGSFNWKQKTPADQELTDVERREFWYSCTGYLIRTDDTQPFLKWAHSVDFWGRWMPEAVKVSEMFLGEHRHLATLCSRTTATSAGRNRAMAALWKYVQSHLSTFARQMALIARLTKLILSGFQ
jgi:hypothetical protein